MINIFILFCLFSLNAFAQLELPKTGLSPALHAISFFAVPARDLGRTIMFDFPSSLHQKTEVQKTKIPAFQKGKVSKTNKARMTSVLNYLFIGVGVVAVLGIALFMGSRMNR